MQDNQSLSNTNNAASKQESRLKRYNLVIPTPLFNEVQLLADREHTSVLELFRRFIKLGLLIAKASDKGAKIIIREGDKERELVFLT